MSRDEQHYYPPLSRVPEGGPSWDPNGPYGQLTDITSERGATIGELAQQRNPPAHGWVRGAGDTNTAVPDYLVAGPPPGPPPGPDPARQAALQTEVHLVLLLS